MRLQAFQRTEHARRRQWGVASVMIFLLLLILLLEGQVLAQASTVIGTITYRDGKPAVHILVMIGNNYRYTDVGGRYKIDNVPPGRQHMVCKQGSTILWQGDVDIAGSQMTLNQKLP
jgi:hypothetical protein